MHKWGPTTEAQEEKTLTLTGHEDSKGSLVLHGHNYSYVDNKRELGASCKKNTSRKIAFVVGSERLFSLVFDPTLTQKTLNQTSV